MENAVTIFNLMSCVIVRLLKLRNLVTAGDWITVHIPVDGVRTVEYGQWVRAAILGATGIWNSTECYTTNLRFYCKSNLMKEMILRG